VGRHGGAYVYEGSNNPPATRLQVRGFGPQHSVVANEVQPVVVGGVGWHGGADLLRMATILLPLACR
jgi:hypothetical protein